VPRVLKLTLAYDGTAYVGWQRQASGQSIQRLLEEALTRIEGAPVAVAGAGRTDAGVHALGQVASASVSTALDVATLRRALNATLPADVRVVQIEHVPDDFHARFSASGKQYDYWIWQGAVQPPFLRLTSWHIPRPLDVGAMDEAAELLQGQHDFAAFKSAGSPVKSSVRTVSTSRVLAGADATWHRASLDPDEPWHRALALCDPTGFGGTPIVVRMVADGFLRHMVRAVVGTLVEIGEGRRPVQSIRALLGSGDRGAAGATAPPHGLVLVRVHYDRSVAPGSGSL
jgi:tRNA pseudouridine38-40 synthase